MYLHLLNDKLASYAHGYLTMDERGTTVGDMKLEMAAEVHKAAKRCGIMVGSVSTMWPMCAMSAFLEACDRLKPEKTQFGTPSIPSALAFRQEQYGLDFALSRPAGNGAAGPKADL
jgi:hypothetical protein